MRLTHLIAGAALSAALSWAAVATAQEAADEEANADRPDAAESDAPTEIPPELLESEYMDEIRVIVGPQGQSMYQLRMEEEARLREAVFEEMEMRQRGEEEVAWRQADIDLENPDSRIKWGYSPQAEARMRRSDSFMFDKPAGGTMPATIFRVEF